MGVLAFIAVIFVYFYLSSKVTALEEEVTRLKTGRTKPIEPGPVGEGFSAEQSQAPMATHVAQDEVHEAIPAVVQQLPQDLGPSSGDKFIAWVKKDFMVKVGALLLLIGFGWFVSYAFANNWIGPAGRIALGLGAGTLFLILGVWRIRSQIHQGGIFTALGSTIVLLTVFAAREIYEFFTPETALGIMFLSIVFVAFVAVRYNSFNLALAGIVLAGVAPMLTNAPTPDVMGLFGYLTVVVLGTLWVVFLKGWNNLTFAALVVVFLWGSPFMYQYANDSSTDIALLFSFLFTAIFFGANIMSIVYNKSQNISKAHIVTGLATAMYLIAWIVLAAPSEWQSLLFVAWMLVFTLGAYIVYHATSEHGPFYVYGAASIALLGAATAVELDGAVLTIAYTLEVGVIVAIASVLLKNSSITGRLSWLFALPVVLSYESIFSRAWNDGVLHNDFFVLVILMFALITAGFFISENSEKESEETTGYALIIIGVLYALGLIWLVFHALFSEDVATMFALVVYTIVGITTYVTGQFSGKNVLRVAGGLLLAFVIGRLLLVEVWQMALTGRIITFFAIGTLLISTAFIGRKHKAEHVVAEPDNQQPS